MKHIHGKTQVYGILGSPIAHSLSPLFQNHFLTQTNIDACYLPFLVAPENIELALQGLHATNIQGLNITIPHKESILNFVTVDKDAQVIGAVNTVKRNEFGWDAINTDWLGFASVIQGLQVNVSTTPVLLFGAGGTSRAILHALYQLGTKQVFLCNRNINRAQSLAFSIKEHYPSMVTTAIAWNHADVEPVIKESQLLINSTSIGLNESDTFPFKLSGEGFALDAVYKPHGETVFCRAASNYISTDGLPMLIAQGIESFAFWFEEELTHSCNLPNEHLSLQWVEQQLGRTALNLPGWEI